MEEVLGSGSANPNHAFAYVGDLARDSGFAAQLRARFDIALRVARSRKENQVGALGVFLAEEIPESTTADVSGGGGTSNSSTRSPTVPLSRFAAAGLILV
jgi:hypothetical protein